MSFTGKATFSAGAALPELAEDVSDVIGIVSPFETPLLDHLGDPRRESRSTVHEWIEDALLPNTDAINQASFTPSATAATSFNVDNGTRFRAGDQIRAGNSAEVMLVTAVAGNTIGVTRGYGGTTPEALADNQKLTILGNASLEGADRPPTRFTNRLRRANYTQIFTASVEVSGSQRAAETFGTADELEFQKQQRMRELLRDLENCVINGVSSTVEPQGSASVRRTMNGILSQIQTNRFEPGVGPLPAGGGAGEDELTEEVLNAAMRAVWETSNGTLDTIVVGGAQKRRINSFTSGLRGYEPGETRFRELVSVYESDFGVCRVVLSRWVPQNSVILLDSSRLSVMPLSGRSFHYKPLASAGDADVGLVVGEYTLEMLNEAAHAWVRGLAV